MDTAPLPPVGHGWDDPGDPDAPTERLVPVSGPAAGHPSAESPSAGLRALEVVAGLLSGGLLVVGLALLVLQFTADDLAPGTGLAAAVGPGWPRTAWQLGVGVAGEFTVLARRWAVRPVRWVLAGAVIVAAAVVLWLAWWA